VDVSYILPLRVSSPIDVSLDRYLEWLVTRTELIVVKGTRK